MGKKPKTNRNTKKNKCKCGIIAILAIIFICALIWYFPQSEYEGHNVMVAYEIANQAIEAYSLIPRVSKELWPAPSQLREIAENTKDACRFLQIAARSNNLDQIRQSFVQDGKSFSFEVNSLAEAAISYTHNQHQVGGYVRNFIVRLNGAFCDGDLNEVVKLLKLMVLSITDAVLETEEMKTKVDTVIAVQDKLLDSAAAVSLIAGKENRKLISDKSDVEESSSIYKWWNAKEYKKRLLEIHDDQEYANYVSEIAVGVTFNMKEFKKELTKNNDLLKIYLLKLRQLENELDEKLLTHIPKYKPSKEECSKYEMMTSAFLSDLATWDSSRLDFLRS